MRRRSREEVAAFCEARAMQMQGWMTTAEYAMWQLLRTVGWSFMAQAHVAGKTKNGGEWDYILDFFEPAHNLAIEVDGGVHKRTKGRDRRRDTRLATLGIRTLRVTNNEVLNHPEQVRAKVMAALEEA